MADNKKYYYMRLKENFFDTDEMVYLESLEEGFLFSNILLKLYLRSLKNEGVLMMNSIVPYDAKMISRFTNHPLSTVEKALFEFQKLGLIEKLDSGQMYMSNIELFVGKTTTEADRKRLGRMKAEQKLLPLEEQKEEEGQMSDKCPPELELELEKELNNNMSFIKEVLDYLNIKANKNYKHSTKKTQDFIKARINEGFTLEEFKIVIDKKVFDWLNTKDDMYLRPETLFGTKFESYLNQNASIKEQNKNKVYEKKTALGEMMKNFEGGNNDESYITTSKNDVRGNVGYLLQSDAKQY